jgi:hypothetical protein
MDKIPFSQDHSGRRAPTGLLVLVDTRAMPTFLTIHILLQKPRRGKTAGTTIVYRSDSVEELKL